MTLAHSTLLPVLSIIDEVDELFLGLCDFKMEY